MKKAILIRTSFVTRVIVDTNESESISMIDGKLKLIQQVVNEFEENIEEIVDDTECPYEELPKHISESEVKLLIKFDDERGKEQRVIVFHDGTEDCWTQYEVDGFPYLINTFDSRVFGSHDIGIGCNVSLMTTYDKENECYTPDDTIEMHVSNIAVI